MDENQFYEKYSFDNLKMVTVLNPTAEDFTFGITMETSVDISSGQMKSETKHYTIKAGGKERLPGVAANLYLDQIAKKICQEEDRFSLYPDFAERAKYYDDLIVTVDDLLGAYQTLPQYDDKQEQAAETNEVPFAQVEESKIEKPEATAERTTSTGKATAGRSEAVASKEK